MTDTDTGKLITALKAYKQADEDGVMVVVSRQACDDAAAATIAALQAEVERLRKRMSAICHTTQSDRDELEKYDDRLEAAEASRAALEVENAGLRAALEDIESKIVDYEAGRINWRPDDFLMRVRRVLSTPSPSPSAIAEVVKALSRARCWNAGPYTAKFTVDFASPEETNKFGDAMRTFAVLPAQEKDSGNG